MVRAMIELFVAAIGFAAQPIALVGYIVLGVYARTFLHAIGYAAAWALAMQLFVTVTGGRGLGDPVHLAVQFGLRAVGAIVLTLGIYLLYRALRGGSGSGSGGRGSGGRGSGGSGNDAAPPKRPSHLRRIK